jgi:hypothetical protein
VNVGKSQEGRSFVHLLLWYRGSMYFYTPLCCLYGFFLLYYMVCYLFNVWYGVWYIVGMWYCTRITNLFVYISGFASFYFYFTWSTYGMIHMPHGWCTIPTVCIFCVWISILNEILGSDNEGWDTSLDLGISNLDLEISIGNQL